MSELTVGAAFGVLLERLRGLASEALRPTTLKWVRSNRQGYGSFVWVCDTIGLNVELAREDVLALRRERLSSIIAQFEAELLRDD